jgi:hypothetical protein
MGKEPLAAMAQVGRAAARTRPVGPARGRFSYGGVNRDGRRVGAIGRTDPLYHHAELRYCARKPCFVTRSRDMG